MVTNFGDVRKKLILALYKNFKTNFKMCGKCRMVLRNDDLHKDLGISTVKKEIKQMAGKHEARLHRHTQIIRLVQNLNQEKRLKERNLKTYFERKLLSG